MNYNKIKTNFSRVMNSYSKNKCKIANNNKIIKY